MEHSRKLDKHINQFQTSAKERLMGRQLMKWSNDQRSGLFEWNSVQILVWVLRTYPKHTYTHTHEQNVCSHLSFFYARACIIYQRVISNCWCIVNFYMPFPFRTHEFMALHNIPPLQLVAIFDFSLFFPNPVLQAIYTSAGVFSQSP